jgi:EAL domain-containing protein (putative c-di-GMP-specific phosphodiesterase class I)/PAS domain-containing protein
MADLHGVNSGTGFGAAADAAAPVGKSSARRLAGLLSPLLVLGAVVCVVQPEASVQLPGSPLFIPVMLALVACFDVLSVGLLVGQFRDTGQRRVLALSWAFMVSLVTMLGWAAAFPGVFAARDPLGAVESTAPWLWVTWHTAFPVLLAAALAPWPPAARRRVPAGRRLLWAWSTVAGAAGAGCLVVGAVVVVAGHLPVVIHGTDTTVMTRVAGPVMLPVVFLATVTTVIGGRRRGGAARWAGLAAAASLGDVVLTLFSYYRFSVGWYAGRTLTIASAAVVMIALLAEFSGLKRRLAVEGERLRTALEHTAGLERLQQMLLGHMADGVLMHGRTGRLLASNPAAQRLLGLTADQIGGRTPLDPGWAALRPDGGPDELVEGAISADGPVLAALRSAAGERDRIVGVRTGEGDARWLSVNTAAVCDPAGAVEYVVSSITDVTERHAGALAAAQDLSVRRGWIRQVLDGGGPVMVFQPIVELSTGKPVGAEALARFAFDPLRSPAEWFAEAADLGMSVELELSAIAAALPGLKLLPEGAYLSVNAGPETAMSPELHRLLRSVPAGRVVLELTEHVGIENYDALTESLDALRARGVRLAVDDTGAGYSSLQHILNLKPDIIKLDRGLVEGIDADPARRALAGSLIAFATEVGAQVVAEGIENLREQTVLRRLGLRYGQGFHLGRPGPLPLPEASPMQAARLFVVNGR